MPPVVSEIAVMLSRRLLSVPPAPPHRGTHRHLLPSLAGGLTAAFACGVLLLFLYFHRISRRRTVPTASDTEESKKPPYRVDYSLIRRATSSFSPSRLLGQGGFGSVYRAELRPGRYLSDESAFRASKFAVKVMDSGSLQGEREFQNELLLSSKIDCKYVVTVMAFSSNPRKRRMVLVYELMENGSLQDCLFHKKSGELRNWDKRFSIALNIAKGLEYFHHYCDPPIIHGDIKPSNILLDANFSAKIGDLGLARLKMVDVCVVNGLVNKEAAMEDKGSVVETESVITTSGFDEGNNGAHLWAVKGETSMPVVDGETVAAAAQCDGLEKMITSEGNVNVDVLSVEKTKKKKKRSVSGKDWWWKQEPVVDVESGTVKAYVIEWLGNEIKNEKPKNDWIGASVSSQTVAKEKRKQRRQLDWWVSMDENKNVKKTRRRPAREWWKEEHCEELERRIKKKKKQQLRGWLTDDYYSSDNWWRRDDEFLADRKKKRRNRAATRGSKGSSIDWWTDGFNGDLQRARGNSYDSEIPKSGGISSTPSMRGTVCYIAPEFCSGGDVSDKCDVYSFGVLLLVLVAGRRPLQVTGSSMSEFKQANLLSWARHLARSGKLLDLVDPSMEHLDEEHALLSITVALLCLQKSPSQRPSMKEVVGMLTGDLPSPPLPVELSPLPSSRPRKKKVR